MKESREFQSIEDHKEFLANSLQAIGMSAPFIETLARKPLPIAIFARGEHVPIDIAPYLPQIMGKLIDEAVANLDRAGEHQKVDSILVQIAINKADVLRGVIL